ncbi:MAG: hypothetical protein Q4C84_08205 [Bacillota bacterium]|nr:hypothetical protein [Bacillota bacterium]
MTIILKNNFRIIKKKHGYNLQQSVISRSKKTGEVTEKIKKYGFYNTIGDCVRAYIENMRDEILADEVCTLEEYVKLSEQCVKLAVKDLNLCGLS